MKIFRMPFAAIALALSMMAVAATGLARANSTLSVCLQDGPCGTVEAVSEGTMASVAGKFTVAGEVVGMNLLMNSSWQGADGQKITGSAGLSLSLPGTGNPGRFSTQANATGIESKTADMTPGSTTATAGNVSGSKGLNNVLGVSQAVQVAGDSNIALNGAAVQITTGNLNSYTGNGSTSATYQAANGAQAKVDIANNSVLLQLQTPDGVAQQNVNRGNNGSIHQNIQIAASRQTIINQLQLEVQVKPATAQALANQGLLQSLNALRGR